MKIQSTHKEMNWINNARNQNKKLIARERKKTKIIFPLFLPYNSI